MQTRQNNCQKSGIVEELATFHDNIIIVVVKSLYSEGACRQDKIIVKKSGIVEELATFHDNIIIVVVKSLHSEGACRHDKIIVKKVA